MTGVVKRLSVFCPGRAVPVFALKRGVVRLPVSSTLSPSSGSARCGLGFMTRSYSVGGSAPQPGVRVDDLVASRGPSARSVGNRGDDMPSALA